MYRLSSEEALINTRLISSFYVSCHKKKVLLTRGCWPPTTRSCVCLGVFIVIAQNAVLLCMRHLDACKPPWHFPIMFFSPTISLLNSLIQGRLLLGNTKSRMSPFSPSECVHSLLNSLFSPTVMTSCQQHKACSEGHAQVLNRH